MRDAFFGIYADYTALLGTSKIILLFLLAMLSLVLIDNKNYKNETRRLLNPAVFLLSLWSGIAYAAVVLISSKKRAVYIAGIILFVTLIALSGDFVISSNAYKCSVYYYTNNLMAVLSAVCIAVFFVIYYMISRQLFCNKGDQILFMALVVLMHAFDFYSEKAAVFSLFLSPVTIGSIVIHDVMPLLLWLYLVYEDTILNLLKNSADTQDDIEEIPEEWDMKKHKIINIRNMAIAFTVFLIVFVAAVFVLNKKINSLYDATVLLENAANTKMAVYELKGNDGTVTLTLMVSPDGTVSAIGGGEKTNEVQSYEFIKKHSERIDRWYLYGDDEENTCVYDYCKDKGIEIGEAFVISGIEKLER